jgi:hypothetical protein
MKPSWRLIGLVASFSLATSYAWGSAALCVERSQESAVVTSEGRCVEGGGINIVDGSAESATLSCVTDNQVRNACGQDGQLARIHAFQHWLQGVKQFEDRCAAEGGTFAYANENFREPHQESFCSTPQPQTSSSMFEETLCNYRSACPPVEVVCRRTCERAS